MSPHAQDPFGGDVFFRIDRQDRVLAVAGPQRGPRGIEGLPLATVLPPKFRDQCLQSLAQARTNAATVELFLQLPSDDSIREFEGRFVAAGDGEVYVWVRDVSESRYALRQLEANQTRMGAVLEAVPDLILTLSARLIVLDYHGPAQEFLTTAPLRLLGADLRDLLPAETISELALLVERVMQTTQIEALEYELSRADGFVAYEARIAPLGGDRVICVLRNITQRRRAERSLLRQRDDLQHLATELTVTEERNRRDLALELHDGIGQDLAVARLTLERSRSLDPTKRETEIDAVIELLKRAIRRSQNLTYDLSPPTLHELGLRPALRSLLRRLSDEYGFEARYEERGPLSDPSEAGRVLLYRSARELLMNVVKHAEAQRVVLSLSVQAGDLILAVEDDGQGFDVGLLAGPAQGIGRFGLFSVRERMAALGGRLTAKSRPGCTRVELRLPFLDPNPPAGEHGLRGATYR